MQLGIEDILCEPQIATATSSGLTMNDGDQASSSSSMHVNCGRAISRHNPIIRDASRLGTVQPTTTPLNSDHIKPPMTNLPNKPQRPHRKSRSQKNNHSSKETPNDHPKSKKIIFDDDDDEKMRRRICASDQHPHHHINNSMMIRESSWSCAKPAADLAFSPPGSTRYLLSTTSSTHDQHISLSSSSSSDFDPLEPCSKISQAAAARNINKDDHHRSTSSASKPTDHHNNSSSIYNHPADEVIVLSVSLHCKGCERKMKKHLSKMEGVSSFDIDFKAKKLTVVGDVTPLALLASVSKVKNARLLTLPVASSVPSVYNESEIRKERGILV